MVLRKNVLWVMVAVFCFSAGSVLAQSQRSIQVNPAWVGVVYGIEFLCDFVPRDVKRSIGDYDDYHPQTEALAAWFSPLEEFGEYCQVLKAMIAQDQGWTEEVKLSLGDGTLVVKIGVLELFTRSAIQGDVRARQMKSTLVRYGKRVYPKKVLGKGVNNSDNRSRNLYMDYGTLVLKSIEAAIPEAMIATKRVFPREWPQIQQELQARLEAALKYSKRARHQKPAVR